MDTTPSIPTHTKDQWILPLGTTMIIVMFLFYIDEGFYDFRWMQQWGNWLAFVLYIAIFFPFQWAMARFLFGRYAAYKKVFLMVGIGVPVTIGLFLLLVS